jgi:hypothetical protein
MIPDEMTSRANPDEEPKPQGGEDRLLVAQPAVSATASEKPVQSTVLFAPGGTEAQSTARRRTYGAASAACGGF